MQTSGSGSTDGTLRIERQGSDVETPQGTGRELSRRRRRIVVPLALVVALGLLGVVAFGGIALVGVGADLQRGQGHLRDARRALANGNLEVAGDGFEAAGDAFDAAVRRSEGIAARAASWLPLVGNNVDVAGALARAGADLAGAGRTLSAALGTLPEGVGSLAPQGGRIPLETLTDLAAPIDDAAGQAADALAAIDAAPSTFLAGPVGQARWDAALQVGEAARTLEAASIFVRQLPAFAGGQGPRAYLVAADNPSELRGSGGFWGAYAVLRMRDGVPTFSSVRSIQDLPRVNPADVEAPSPDYGANYDQFGGVGSWFNLNMTPDFPTAARASIGAYEAATGRQFDGMIAADPFALEAMLAVTGPTEVPGIDEPLTADNVVAFTTNEAYSVFGRTSERKEVLGDVAIAVLERFLRMEDRGIERLRTLGGAIGAGHLRVYTRDEDLARGFDLTDASGSYGPPAEGDVVGVHINNASASKVDYYVERTLTHEVILGGKGEAISTTAVRLANEAPTGGQPGYVIGPNFDGGRAGDARSLTTIACHPSCSFVDAGADGDPVTLNVGSEAGVPWFRDFATVHSGDRRTLEITTRSSGVWEGNASGGVYRLTVLGQTTIRPTQLRLVIEAPAGTSVVWTSHDMDVHGSVAIWEGVAGPHMEFEVRFSAPAPLRWWRNVLRPFGGL
jgi:hypothetical protein